MVKTIIDKNSSEKADGKFKCKCKLSYNLNSSLYNHIRLKHCNNIEEYAIKNKIGRPINSKNKSSPKSESVKKRVVKIIQCKCGEILKGEGSFSNHLRYKHKDQPEFRNERKKQGRPKKNTSITNQIPMEQMSSAEQIQNNEDNLSTMQTESATVEETDIKQIEKYIAKEENQEQVATDLVEVHQYEEYQNDDDCTVSANQPETQEDFQDEIKEQFQEYGVYEDMDEQKSYNIRQYNYDSVDQYFNQEFFQVEENMIYQQNVYDNNDYYV